MRSRRGPECLGVRASWPPVVGARRDERPPCPPAASDVVIDAPCTRSQSVSVRCDTPAHIPCVCPAREAADLPGRGCEFVARSCVHPLARPRNFAPASLRAQRSIHLATSSRSPCPTAYRTEYTDDTLSAPSSGNARAPCHGRPNGRSPAAGSSWPVSFSSAPLSFRQPCFQEPWLPARQWKLPQARFRRSARPAPARRRPARHRRTAVDAATTRRDSFCIGSSGTGQRRYRPDPITSAAVRTPGFWRRG